jgi:uncharacterized oxidoreductase
LDTLDSNDTGSLPAMNVEKMIEIAINGLKKNHFEIRPGLSNIFKWMSRIAPKSMLKQTSKSIDNMLSKTN